MLNFFKTTFLIGIISFTTHLKADNQTPTVDIPTIAGSDFPFSVRIELADFELPNGIQSGVIATYKNKVVLLAGRTNGLHGFDNDNDNFPPKRQNKVIYVINPKKGRVWSRSLEDSDLASWQVDLLSVTSPQYLQKGDTCYLTGGYGVNSRTGLFSTKNFLTAINLPGIIRWVTRPNENTTLSKHLRHLSNPIFQVTGGDMKQINNGPILLCVGQNFRGFYTSSSNGIYSEQIRRFHIHDDGKKLGVTVLDSLPIARDPNLRRRDLNIVPLIRHKNGKFVKELDILSGVFTVSGGIWTVPVRVNKEGVSFMLDPTDPTSFKQAMNNYNSATFGMYSKKTKMMYTILLGGLTYGYFINDVFETDPEVPFTNEVTTIALDNKDRYTQYLMDASYPVILSTISNPGNPFLFGAGAKFVLNQELSTFKNQVIKFDDLKNRSKKEIFVGYIFGGIASTLPNTSTQLDSIASPYVFKVFIEINDKSSSESNS